MQYATSSTQPAAEYSAAGEPVLMELLDMHLGGFQPAEYSAG
jgi:hypothetical protein